MKLFLFVLIASIYCIQILDCCAYGEGCRFPCRCNIGVTCDPVTGICEDGFCAQVLPEGHDFGWKDSGCRRGNIALNKTTNQSDDYEGHTSDRAVDGNTNPNLTHGSCAHPSFPDYQAWWMVDLERNYIIEEIIIFNRDERGERTNDFTIRIGVNDTIQDQPLCINYTNGQEEVLHLNCTEPVSEGRFISMERNQGGEEPGQINICEFVVIGFAPMDCNENCEGNCHLLTGCDKCYPGYKLPDCIDECNFSSWGVNCANRCGGCASQTCDKVLGSCNGICQEWYINDKCSTYIVLPSLKNTHLTVQEISSSSVNVTWEQFLNVSQNAHSYYFYKVVYNYTDGENIISKISENITHNPKAVFMYFVIYGLVCNTKYTVTVVPYREQNGTAEAGESSMEGQHKTKCRDDNVEGTIGPPTMSNMPVIIGSAVGVMLVIILVISILVIRTRRRQAMKSKSQNIGNNQHAPSSLERRESFNVPVKDEKNLYANLDGFEATCIPVLKLAAYIRHKQKESDGFKHEFSIIPDGIIHPVAIASEGCNLGKNRFRNIKAYDDSRVILEKEDDDPSADYINACFIPGYSGYDKQYIAGQGPLPHTIADTWRMVWQYDVTRIVMVTNEQELGQQKCERYWPNTVGEYQEYGDILITLTYEEIFTDFTIRTIKCAKMHETKRVFQFHFTSWPDKQALDTALPLLQFRHKIKSYPEDGSLFVHCSAGVGRTGTYIAIDYLVEQGLAEDKVDVYRCVTKLRDYRMHMVQTLAQYELIYKAVYEAFSFGGLIRCCELDAKIEIMGPEMAEQHQKINEWIHSLPASDGDLDGLRPENISKNRDNSIIPEDFDRPYLNTPYANGSDYVNAVYINSYSRALAYIVTQFSLPSTIPDFWRLVYDHKCGVIVTLGDIDSDMKYENTKATYYNLDDVTSASFWPDVKDKREEYGPIEVSLRHKDTQGMTTRNMEVKASGVNKCQSTTQIEFCDWREEDLPEIDRFIELIQLIEKLKDDKEGPVLIQCFNGADKSGLLVAALYITEYMKLEQQVDVVNSVRSVKKYRRQFVKDQNQYEFLYKVAQSYNQLFPTYANIM